ncbi:MAG: hypothetical protein M1825_000630 [Sarcosagium campestre]|nr:MAG: hypothetical protein M1825_000630 [Sarcosagium campestre]
MAISNHLSRKRPADTFLDFVTHSSSIIIVFLNELSSSTAEAASNVSAADAVCSYIESNPDCSLASVMDRDHQRRKLKMVADDILHNFLDRRLNCEPVTVFLREILAGVILEMTIETCSKPEWINGWIVHLLEDGEPELMNAIDAGVTGKPHEGVIDSPISQQGDGDMFDSTSAGLERSHRRRMSKAEQAMQDAMLEAEKLNKMIADEDAARKDSLGDVPTPVPQHDVPEPEPEPEPEHLASANRLESSAFTSFDQLAPTSRPTALRSNGSNGSIPIATTPEKPTFTLHHANVSIFDDSTPTDKGVMRSKPTADYLIQIEPAASEYPGWMIARKYVDFLTLHEVLRRISVVSGVVGFKEQHGSLPNWKGQTKAFFRTNLERYLKDALSYRQLAESEGMKRFLEKERGLDRPNGGSAVKGGFPGIGWPSPASFETMGKGMLDALASAPKGAAGGGKAIIGGVTGVLGGAAAAAKNQRHPSVDVKTVVQPGGRRVSNGSLVRNDSTLSRASSDLRVRSSQEVAAHSPGGNDELTRQTSLHGHTASEEKGIDDALPKPVARTSLSSSSSSVDHVSADQSRATSALATSQSSLTSVDETKLNLPPLPSDIPDNYGSSTAHPHRPDAQTTSLDDVWTDAPIEGVSTPQVSPEPTLNVSKPKMENAELSEEETRVAVELLFAVINELYTLSSAWNIRRTLLTAAKTFLLRPGNPSLEAIRVLLQDSVIEANTSDSGIASHIRTLEKNSLPAEDELKGWPSAPSQEEKDALRVKARQLLIERGMPQALTSVMGSAASGEALGRVFDCLQVDEVARGLMFGVILQALRAVTQ